MLNIMLQILNICIEAREATLVEDILGIVNRVLGEAALKNNEMDTGDKEELTKLLQAIDSEFVQSRQNIIQSLMEMIPFLSFGDEVLMEQLINHFNSVLSDLKSYDSSTSDQHRIYLESFCDILKGLKPDNPGGKHLKDLMFKRGLPQQSVDYLRDNIPADKDYDSDEWKNLLAKPVLPFVLRILAGLCRGHFDSQKLIGENCVPELHRLEQVSAEGNIGSLAEEALEALRDNESVFKRVTEARRATRADKKKHAMQMRDLVLKKFNMSTNQVGQVQTKSKALTEIGELVDETGPVCVICREGYNFEPKKILSIYIYCKRSTVEPYETASRKTVGFESVSYFNFVHNECHQQAIRYKRSRDEWESASLQNTNTKCNAMLPLWGPCVSDSIYASSMARFNESVREATGVSSDISWMVHDVKLLLTRFATNSKFHLDSGGGGPESNMKLIPYLVQAVLYTLNSMRNYANFTSPIDSFLANMDISLAWVVQGPFYLITTFLMLCDHEKWAKSRVTILQRLVVTVHAREVSINPKTKFVDGERVALRFEKYRQAFIFWWLIDQFFAKVFHQKKISEVQIEGRTDAKYPEKLQSFLRNNDSHLHDSCKKIVTIMQREMYEIDSVDEFRDVSELYDVIGSDFLEETLKLLPESDPSDN